MALKSVFDAMKRDGGYVVKPLDLYLLSLNNKDNDRAIDVNAPSQVGTCCRARYYARTGEKSDVNSVDGRARRIFDNGTHYHLRMQDYMLNMKLLLMDEVPVLDEEHNIQGHTDGILNISRNLDTVEECAILELKSINSRGFESLKAVKPEHKMQGLVYVYCIEKHRKYLQEKYKTEEAFRRSAPLRKAKYAKRYQHLKDGSKFTRKQKIAFQVGLHMKLDNILYYLQRPVTKCIFVYENKDNQELKEYCVSSTEADSKNKMKQILIDFDNINHFVEVHKVPPREGNSKSSNMCRWCSYKDLCFIT